MTEKNKSKSPKIRDKFTFEAPSAKKDVHYDLTSLHSISLPGINTILPQRSNPPLHIVSEKAVGIVYTKQQQTVLNIDNVDPSMISGNRANKKNPPGTAILNSAQLRAFAKSIGINPQNKRKKQLADEVLAELERIKSHKDTGEI